MTTRQRISWPEEAQADEARDPPLLRLAEHAVGLWQAAQDVGDPVMLDALRPLVLHIARSVARDVMEGETAH